ncbi:MAG: rod shape-determining protein MreC [Pseudomonadota bacterium]|nr:rod shape-determining protein MreC [Pseudomonadota bacterium]
MALGTIDRTPPPFFRQGPSALTKLVFFAALAVFLMVADVRFKFMEPLREALAVVLLPVQRTLAVPVQVARGGAETVQSLRKALQIEHEAREQLASQSAQVLLAEQLRKENERLRALLELRSGLKVQSTAAEIVYEAADPYSRKVVIDRGSTHGVAPGSPVIDEAGVLGQVTRVFPLTSEVTLLADKDAAIPIVNARTQQRGVVFGGNGLELRYTSANADVAVGDALLTSGLDGVYPGGLPVAQVAAVDRRMETGFARITLAPAARPDGVRLLLVLAPVGLQLPPRPEPEASTARPADRLLQTPRRK